MPGSFEIGSEFAGYRIEAVLGRGGMGVVYVAEQIRLGRRVALKVLAPELSEDEEFRERFIGESRLAASLEHPSIIPVYDADEVEGVLFIAMRYVEGPDLRTVIERDGRLGLQRTISIVEQVGSALDAAHARNLVHRDVKPANVLCEAASERVYLTDFGVAKHSSSRGLTRTGFFIGTVDYAPPEQIEGRAVDARSDVYALACVVYECLTGAAPFERNSDIAVLHAHLLDPPPTVSRRRPDLPPALDTVIHTGMAKAKDDRSPSCTALVEAMKSAATRGAAAAPAAARATTLPATVARPPATISVPSGSRKRRLVWAAAGAAVLAVVAGGVAAALLVGSDDNEAATRDGTTVAAGSSGGATKGQRIAFRSDRDGGNAEIYVMNADGSGVTRLTRNDASDADPAWSPDGKRIAFASYRDGDFEVYVMKADGSGQRRLTRNRTFDGQPSWSPDGKRIAFASDRDGDFEVYAMNADGGGLTRLTSNRAFDVEPAWSTDGKIAFRSDRDGNELWVMKADGSGQTKLTSIASNFEPAWSPNGKQIAFRSDRDGNEIYLMEADGSGQEKLTKNLARNDEPSWSRDGRRIAFASEQDGNTEIYVIEADGTSERNLTNSPADDDDPDWQH